MPGEGSGQELAKAYVTIAGDDSQLQKDLANTKGNVSSWLSSLASGLGAVAAIPVGLTALLAGGVFVAGAAALTGWTLRAIDAEVAGARLSAILETVGKNSGQSTETISELAKAIELTSNFSKGEAKAAAAELLKFNEIKGDNFNAAMKAAADYATVLGTDLVSAANQVGIALQNPLAAIRSLRQVGLTPQQGKELQGLVKAGKIDEAREKVLDFFQTMSGASEKMTETVQYQIDGLWRDLKRLGMGMGTAMLPVVKEFFTQLRDGVAAVKPGFDRIGEVFSENLPVVKDVIAYVGSGLVTAVQYATTVVLNLSDAWNVVKAGAAVAFTYVGLQWAKLRAYFSGSGTDALESALIDVAFVVGKTFATVQETIQASWQAIIKTILDSLQSLVDVAKTLPNFGLADQAQKGLDNARKTINQPITKFDDAKFRQALEDGRKKQNPEDKANIDEEIRLREQLVDANKDVLQTLIQILQEKKAGLFPEGAKEAALDAAKEVLARREKFEGSTKETPVKFSFVGLADAWKKMQESITGGTMVELTKAGLAQGKEQLDELKDINRKIGNEADDDDGIIGE